MKNFVFFCFLVTFSVVSFAQSAEKPVQSDLAVGDYWKWEQKNSTTNVVDANFELTVFDDNGLFKFKRQDGRIAETDEIYSGIREGVKKPKVVWPLKVGSSWDFEEDFVRQSDKRKGSLSQKAKVTSYEEVSVPAGKFMAFKIEYDGWYKMFDNGSTGERKEIMWYSPETKSMVKLETFSSRFNYVRVLTSYKSK